MASSIENIDNNESLLFINDVSDNQSSNSGKSLLEESVREKLIKAQDILGETVIEPIRKEFENLHESPKTFEDYQKLINCENSLLKLLKVPIDEELVVLDQLNNEDNGESNQLEIKQKMEKVRDRLTVLKDLKEFANHLTSQMVYSKRLNFIHNILNSPDPDKKAILFRNILFTEGAINKRYRELSSCFHPDRTKYFNAPNGLHGNDQYLGAELFRIILEIKEGLLKDLEKASESKGRLNFHEEKANANFNIANDFRNAYKNNGKKLKILNKDDINGIPNKQLRDLSVSYGLLAHGEYQAACKVADIAKELKQQIKLRKNMALCLYISDHSLESQLYALSAIRLIFQNSQHVSQKELVDAKKVFDKVRGETSQLNTDIKLNDDLSNSQALVKVVNEGMSFLEKCDIQNSVNDDLRKISAELMFKPDRRVVSCQVSQEDILHSNKQTVKYKIAGVVSLMGECALVSVGVASAVFAPIISTLWLAPLISLWYSSSPWKQGTMLLDEPKIRENLNEIIKNALNAYDEGNYQQFFDLLREEYEKDTSIIKLKESNIIIPEIIIDSLLSHGFRSDGIAYLLNLIGEVLSSNKIKTPDNDISSEELRTMGKFAFKGVLYEKLMKKAKALDDRIHALREDNLKSMAKSIFHNIIDFLRFKPYSELAKEYKDDARKMPFQSRLEEMRNIARLNLVIFDIISNDKSALVRISKIVEEIRKSLSINYQFFSTTESRLEALEDFLWVMRGDVPKSPLIYSIEPAEKQFNEEPVKKYDKKYDKKYMEYLKDKLQRESNNDEILNLHSKLADHFVKLAEEGKVDLLSSLRHWHNAKEHYKKVCEMSPGNLSATLNFAKCLLNLSQHNRLIKLIDTNRDLTSFAEYWRLCSIASYKETKYDEAMEFINEALNKNPQNILVTKQKRLLDRVKEHSVENRVNCHNKKIYYADKSFKNLHRYNEDNSVYRILSIDGGGVRSILPALWLSELEYRTRKPISQLFNMVAGTSTGGFIGAGLSMPCGELSSLKPLYSATNLLEFYQNQAKSIFTPSSSWNFFTATKYTDEGRSSIFDKYFGKIRLNQALNNLVIPAVKDNMQPHLFTRNNSDDTLFDILMAATAAPTFFPSYEIKNRGIFVDGGVKLNNPALTAYSEFYESGDTRKVTVLSLGTGSYIPDPLHPDLHHYQLFWKYYDECNVDDSMYSILGNCYQRWQVLLGKPVALDDFNSISYLLELGHQYIEELDASDENSLNVLVESFESG
ncbi:8978_t:CDS:1 [Dentiscutata erythropus]|uniref:8978_t:CDS:1 n=1 Tax=Dentiscutata erythropus TaxID=1348616 RepID=A0A9N9FTS9_9GLOM|nr:8978_t:CDS:1 [Dentiscutata erythropus]